MQYSIAWVAKVYGDNYLMGANWPCGASKPPRACAVRDKPPLVPTEPHQTTIGL